MAKLSKRTPQGPLPGKRSKIPNLPPSIPHHDTREEIELRDMDDPEGDDDDEKDNGDQDNKDDDDDEDNEDEDDETEMVYNGDQAHPRRRGSAAALKKPEHKKFRQKHQDMKETQQLHSQLTFGSSEISQPAVSLPSPLNCPLSILILSLEIGEASEEKIAGTCVLS